MRPGVDRHPDRVHRGLARRHHPAPYREPDLPRGFKVPGYPVTPILSIARLRLHPVQPALVHLAGLRLLGRRLPGVLPPLRPEALGAGPGAAGEDASRWWRRSDESSSATSRTRAAAVRWISACSSPTPCGDAMAVVTVVPRQWSTPSMAKVDAEYAEYARQVGTQAEASRPRVPASTPASTSRSTYRAVTRAVGLVRARSRPPRSCRRQRAGARLVARRRRGSDRGRLDHRQAAALLADPAGDQPARLPVDRRRRLQPGDLRVLRQRGVGAGGGPRRRAAPSSSARPLRVASFGVRGATMYPPEVGLSAEDSVLDSWREQAAARPEPAASPTGSSTPRSPRP